MARTAVALAVLLLAGTSSAQVGPPKTRLTFAYVSPAPAQSTPFWIAKEAGFYDKHGLDVTMQFISGSPRALQAVIARQVQLAVSGGPTVVDARLGGSDAVLIVGLVNVLPYYLITRPEIVRPADLRGKVGANHIPGTTADFATRLGMRRLGLEPGRDVTLRPVGETTLRLQAVQSGAAHFTFIPQSDALLARKMGLRVLVDLAKEKIPFQHTTVVTTQRYIRENEGVVLRFTRAVVEAIHYYKTNKEGTFAIDKKYSKVDDREVFEDGYNWHKDVFPEAPYPTVEGMRLIIDDAAQTRPEARGLEARTLIDNRFVKQLELDGFIKAVYKRK